MLSRVAPRALGSHSKHMPLSTTPKDPLTWELDVLLSTPRHGIRQTLCTAPADCQRKWPSRPPCPEPNGAPTGVTSLHLCERGALSHPQNRTRLGIISGRDVPRSCLSCTPAVPHDSRSRHTRGASRPHAVRGSVRCTPGDNLGLLPSASEGPGPSRPCVLPRVVPT